MRLDDFKGQNKDGLSMIEATCAILQDSGKRMAFADIINIVQSFLGKSDKEIRECLPQSYTNMNTGSESISIGDSVWALRSRPPYESVDEEVSHPEDEGNVPHKKHHKKTSAFVDDPSDDDIIDYNSDDLGNEDLDVDDSDNNEDDYSDDDLDDTDDDGLDDDTEGRLSELHQDDLDDDDD